MSSSIWLGEFAQRVLGVALASLTAGLLFAPMVTGAARSADATLCGGTNNPVEREFKLAHASDFAAVFPAAGLAPELAADERPARVVVFAGSFDASSIARTDRDGKAVILEDVVCVIDADGIRNVYYDVSKAGAQIP